MPALHGRRCRSGTLTHPVASRVLLLLAACWMGSAFGQPAAPAPAPNASPAPTRVPVTTRVILKTSLGDIVLALETERAPVTASNFLHYVDRKRFDGTTFYRAMKLDDAGQTGLIQAGLQGNPGRVFKPIAHEPTTLTGLSHVDGAISMARGDPGTATADFFIVVGDLTGLDAHADGSDPGYAVFGHVVEGMDVVRSILRQPCTPDAGEGALKGQMLAAPVKILSARRAD